ncbi:MAG: biotin--[acetyl-CoA-carboxylase] ligase [bacterium]
MVNLASGITVHHYSQLDSTNKEAKRWFEQGGALPCWFITDEQTAGYGRHGRLWEQMKGNFAASLATAIPVKKSYTAYMSFVAAMAVRTACIKCGIDPPLLKLKWPNDVLLEGKKLSGLLLEMVSSPNGDALVMGIGVNLLFAPKLADRQTACVADYVNAPSQSAFLKLLDEELQHGTRQLAQKGFGPIRQQWLAHAIGIGQTIKVVLPQGQRTGRFEDINDEGALLLREGEIMHTITAGDVFF